MLEEGGDEDGFALESLSDVGGRYRVAFGVNGLGERQPVARVFAGDADLRVRHSPHRARNSPLIHYSL